VLDPGAAHTPADMVGNLAIEELNLCHAEPDDLYAVRA
jgi:hypothetical protein